MSNRDLYPWDLQQAEATIRSSAACTLPVTSSVMCIGGPNGERSDNMDSGGPAVRRVPGGGWELVGHVVAGSQTADYSTSTFADTARHAKWITSLTSGRTAMPAATGNVPSSLNGTARVGDCSGVVVDVPDARPTDGALVLTNGHCASPRPEPGAATGSVIDKQTVMVLDRNGYTALRGATVERIYSTMTDTDLAVYRTDLTYAAIRRSGLDTYELADEQLQPGDRLTLVSSAWGAEMTCSVEAIVPTLQEGGYRQRGAIRYTQSADCGPGPGTSGAPLLNADGKIVGLHNTSVSTLLMLDENDEQIKAKPCDVNNPCEVAEDGTATLAGGDTAYGQHLYGLAHCLSIEGMNFQSPGCDLIAAPGAGTATASSSTWVDWVVPIGLVLLIFAGGVTRIILPRGRQDRVSPTDDYLTA